MNANTEAPLVSDAQLQAACAEHRVEFWGKSYVVRPVPVSAYFGDGGRLLGLAPVNSRPQFYIVRIDSGWDDLNSDAFRDSLDEVYEAMEDEYGCARYETDSGTECIDPWPAFDYGDGTVWWHVAVPEVSL